MKETIMNQEKLAKLQAQVRIGGKVITARITSFPLFILYFFSLCYIIVKQLFLLQVIKKMNLIKYI